MTSFVTIGQLVEAAQEALGPEALAYSWYGAGEEVTFRRNGEALRRIAVRPRVLRDVHAVDTSTTFLGHELRSPAMLAPVGAVARYHPDGAVAAARGSADRGTLAVVGMQSSPGYDEVVAAAGPQFFQVYIGGDRGWLAELMDRIESIGCLGFCITVDSPVESRRDRLFEGGHGWRLKRQSVPPNLVGLGRDRSFAARLTWADVEWLVGHTELPIILKGVMHEDDARQAADLGVRAIYVSNHGGRELDHGLSTIEVLERIVHAVGDDSEVVVDSGFSRGADVCKALAMGARAVLIGRLQCWGLAVGGASGVANALDILQEEVSRTMALLGVTDVSQLGPGHLAPTIGV